jgi:hypothetical protein
VKANGPQVEEASCLRRGLSAIMESMGVNVQVCHLDYYLPDGRLLLSDASFRVG